MMNVFAIGLVLASLVTAGVWSPSPPPHHEDHREVIVKEGHRVVVVEYDKEADGSTKVLISPQDADLKDEGDGKEKPAEGMFSGPRELVCDAYGKCVHKIANALGKTKDKVTETAHDVSEKAHEVGHRAKEAVSKSDLGKAKDKSENTVGEALGKAKDSVGHGIDKAKKVADDVVSTVKDGASKVKNFDMVDSPKRMGEDISRNVTGKVEEGVQHAKHRVEEGVQHAKHRVEETVENVQEVGQKTLGEILSKLKEVSYDILWYLVSRDKIDSVVGLIHMLGFSTAYGMCVWVTFVSSYILGRYLPRQQFGVVQSRIYPVYFKAMAYCVSAALLGHLLGQNKSLTSKMGMFQSSSLLSALLMVLSNLILLEPRATKLMYERMKIEKEEGRGMAAAAAAQDGMAADGGGATVLRPVANAVAERQDLLRLDDKLKRVNGYSSALNVSTLVVLTWHMAYMAQRLQAKR